MVLSFCDSFDHYPTNQLAEKWDVRTGLSQQIVNSPARTGKALSFSDNFGRVAKDLGVRGTFIVGVAVYVPSHSPGAIFCLYDDVGGGPQVTVSMDGSGVLRVQQGGAFGPVLGTSGVTLPTLSWHYLEAKITFDGATGFAELLLDTTVILTLSSVNTAPTGFPWANVLVLNGDAPTGVGHGLFIIWYVDDLYVLDATSGPNDDYLFAPSVQVLDPNGEGDLSGLRPVGASPNWRCVDGGVPGDWTSYVGGITPPQADLYTVPTPNVLTVYAVQTCLRRRIVLDPTGLSITELIRSNGNDFLGNESTGPDAYYNLTQHDVDPDTLAQWTPDGVGHAQFGVQLTPP
jgi:hypothetical protein